MNGREGNGTTHIHCTRALPGGFENLMLGRDFVFNLEEIK